MNFERTRSRSGYLHWAKTVPPASSNLATSGIARLPLDELPFDGDDWELSPPGGYGYAPLQERLAEKCHVSLENVIAATGASMANFLAMAAVLEPGDEVLIEHPTYEPLLAVAAHLGAEIRRFPRAGDLAPLAHLTQVLIGEGEAIYQDKKMPGQKALELAGIAHPCSSK